MPKAFAWRPPIATGAISFSAFDRNGQYLQPLRDYLLLSQ
jgi:hypothetical protein